jgi:hypothetical protein
MKIILWSLLALFLIGDAFFVLPYHFSNDAVTTNYYINYKKDSALLRNVFPDSGIQLKLNMPPGYETLYNGNDAVTKKRDSPYHLFVNVSVFHNLDFMALSFPFYKITTFNGVIPFYSIIKASNAPDMDSTALIGNIVINGKIAVKGICTPLYARTLVEKNLASILKNEVSKIEADINRPPAVDTGAAIIELPLPVERHAVIRRSVKNVKKKKK